MLIIMNLKFPLHFQYRLIERGIDVDHVKKAVRSPDSKEETFEGRIRVRKKIEGVDKEIEVIYFKEQFRDKKEEYIVVTAYYLEQEKP